MLTAKELLGRAQALEPQLVEWRRTLHRHPEVGFDLTQTKALVKKALTEMGYEPRNCGKAGVIALAGGKKPGKTILLRADMDALPIQEESGVDYASEVPGKMHGCGHDMHTAMMLGAAQLLKEHEDEIEGTVKLEFQPAEEIFQGSPDMIANGLLENPSVDAAVMFHVLGGMPIPAGVVLVPACGGITMASCEQYHIIVHGKGGHGSTPENCIDPITAAAHIHIALQEINSRELDAHSFGVFTTGRFQAGAASNVIPDTAEMWGTIRTTDPEGAVTELLHKRMTEIVQGVATAYRCTAEITFSDYCPCMVVDKELAGNALTYMGELLGKGAMDMTPMTGGARAAAAATAAARRSQQRFSGAFRAGRLRLRCRRAGTACPAAPGRGSAASFVPGTCGRPQAARRIMSSSQRPGPSCWYTVRSQQPLRVPAAAEISRPAPSTQRTALPPTRCCAACTRANAAAASCLRAARRAICAPTLGSA